MLAAYGHYLYTHRLDEILAEAQRALCDAVRARQLKRGAPNLEKRRRASRSVVKASEILTPEICLFMRAVPRVLQYAAVMRNRSTLSVVRYNPETAKGIARVLVDVSGILQLEPEVGAWALSNLLCDALRRATPGHFE